MIAIKYILESFHEILQHEKILWNSDNLIAARIIHKGSKKPHLRKIAFDIFELCLKYDIIIITKWIPRALNDVADNISKSIDTDDWTIDFETFNYVQQNFGNFTVNRFASDSNNKVEKFNSKFYCPTTKGVNAFTFDWSKEFNWLCPPISLVGACINHLKSCKGRGVLLVPRWESAFYWPLLTPNGDIFYDFVKHVLCLQPFYISPVKNSIFKGFAPFITLALYLDFVES